MRRLSYDEALDALCAGELVVVPTDTVYGIAASLAHPDAVRRLFTAKDRPAHVALPIMVAGPEQVETLGVVLAGAARRLTDALWPGALTVVVPAASALASEVGGRDSVGLRVPNDEPLRALLRQSGPLALTSANRHGEPPCVNAAQALVVFASSPVAGVVDDGERSGAVSSVVDCTRTPPVVLRHGAIDDERLDQLLR